MFPGIAYGHMADYLLWVVLYGSLLVHTWCFFKLFPRLRWPKVRLALGNAMIAACLLGSVALLAETYIRFLSVGTDSFGMSLPARRWFLLHTRENALGFRDHQWRAGDAEGVRRIAFVGDSFTYGWGVDRVEDRFTDRLQARFDDVSAGSVEVMNVAKPGWDTGDQLAALADLIDKYGVDEVVLCHVPNDIEKLIPVTADSDPTEPPQSQFFNTDTSCLLEYLYYRIAIRWSPIVYNYHDWLAAAYNDPTLWSAQQQRLVAIHELCQQREVSLRVVLLPYMRTGGERFDSATVHAQVRGIFERRAVPVVDLLSVLDDRDPDDLVVNFSDPHPNAQAHRLFGDRIWDHFYAR